MMKKLQWIASLLLVASFLVFPSCSSSTTTINGNWVNNVYAFSGKAREGAFQFTIGNNTAYVGLGYGGINGTEYLLDTWRFNIDSLIWEVVAPFPGVGREQSVSFSVGGKGYVGLGYNRLLNVDSTNFNDFWEFDPNGQTLVAGETKPRVGAWTRLNNYPGGARFNAMAFATSTNAYVGGGTDGGGDFFNDCYIYSPGTDTWEEFLPFPGDKREGAMTLILNGKVWFFGGDSNNVEEFDLWQLDPAATGSNLKWTIETETTDNSNYNDFKAGVRRSNACAFVLNDLGYVAGGDINGGATTLVYQFDPIAMTWVKMTAIERSARTHAVSFVLTPTQSSGLGGATPRAFIATGVVGTKKLDECDEWQPTVAYNATD
jgi:N-acetylneuraminic acid mutarotase